MQINQGNNSLKSILPPVILTDCTLWYCIRTVFCSRQKNLLWQLSSNTQLLLLLEKYAHVVVGLHTAAKSAKLFNPELDIFIMFSWFSLGSVFKKSRSFISCEQGNKQREQNWIKIQIYIRSEWCIMRPLPPSLWMLCSHSVYLGSSQILSTCGFSKTQQIFKMVWEQWTRVLSNVNRTECSTLWHHQMEIKLGIYQFFISRSWKKFPHNLVSKTCTWEILKKRLFLKSHLTDFKNSIFHKKKK